MERGRNTTQSGSIAVFAIVAVLLSAAVIGCVYLVQKRGYQARASQPIMEVDTQQTPAESNTQQNQNDDRQSEEERRAAEQADADEKKRAEEVERKRIEAEQRAAAEAERQRQAQADQQSATPAEVPHTGAAPQELPTTGPADTLMQVVAGGSMVAVVMAYLKSYRYRFGSLLK